MSDKPISPLRRRMIDDMTARRFKEKVQKDYVRHVRTFAGIVTLAKNSGILEGSSTTLELSKPLIFLSAADDRFARLTSKSRQRDNAMSRPSTPEAGIVTLASFTCQWRDALMGRTQRNQWLAEFESGAGYLENPLFLANVTMPWQ